MKLEEVQELISSVADSGACEFKLDSEDVKIVVKANREDQEKNLMPPVIVQNGIAPQVAEIPNTAIHANGVNQEIINENKPVNHTIKSCFVGTCLLKALNNKSTNIGIGDTIKKGDVLCSIEALGLLNEIKSDVSGKVTAILLEDFSPVEYDQPLFSIAS